jgi:hypothetical protein
MTTIRPGAEAAARAAISARVAAILDRVGPPSAEGRPDPDAVIVDPAATAELGEFWVRGHRDRDGRPTVDGIAGPGLAGAVLAYETARQLGVRLVDDPERIRPGERVVVVSPSALSPGLAELIEALEAAGGEIVGCHAIVGPRPGRAVVRSARTRRRYALEVLWRPRRPPTAAGDP